MLQKDVAIPGEMDISSFPFKEGDSQLLLQALMVREGQAGRYGGPPLLW